MSALSAPAHPKAASALTRWWERATGMHSASHPHRQLLARSKAKSGRHCHHDGEPT